jgi:hypothetical protein
MTSRYLARRTTVAARASLAALLLPLSFGMPAPAQAPAGDAETPKSSEKTPDSARITLRHANAMEVGAAINGQLGIAPTVVQSANLILLPMTDADTARRAIELARELDDRATEVLRQRFRDEREMAMQREKEAMLMAVQEEKRLADLSLTIDFPGGTVAEYLELVRTASGFDNVVVGSDAILALKMPRVKVRRITGTAAVLLLQTLRFDTNGNSVRMTVDTVPGDPDGVGIDALPVLVVDLDPSSQNVIPSEAVRTEVVNLSAFQKYEPNTVKELLGAIEVGIGLEKRPTPIEVKLHEGTGLLFVRGTDSDLRLVTETINAFIGDRPQPQPK